MNVRLTPEQIDEIIAGAEHVDVPAERLIAAATEIRAVLLAATADITLDISPRTLERAARARRDERARSAGIVRTALVAAALTLALLLTAAAGGALPEPIRAPVARVSNFFGINLPTPDEPRAVDTTSGTPDVPSEPNGVEGPRKPSAASGGADEPKARSDQQTATAETTASESRASTPTTKDPPGANGNPNRGESGGGSGAYDNPTHEPAHGNGPTANNGNGNGPSENNGNGPPADPGNANGNGPTEDNGNGNGNGNRNATENPRADGGASN